MAHPNVQMRNVLIEPQSQSEELVAMALHLNHLLNTVKKYPKRRGRLVLATAPHFALIKLHPTLHEDLEVISLETLL